MGNLKLRRQVLPFFLTEYKGGNIAFVVFSKMCNQFPNRVYQKLEQGHLIVKFGPRERAFEHVFGPAGREFEQANFQKFKCPGCCTANLLRGTEVHFPAGTQTQRFRAK